jgi:hypothetical protein
MFPPVPLSFETDAFSYQFLSTDQPVSVYRDCIRRLLDAFCTSDAFRDSHLISLLMRGISGPVAFAVDALLLSMPATVNLFRRQPVSAPALLQS